MTTSADAAGPQPAAPRASGRGRGSGATLRRWLPPQHGAWAMLLLPFGIGVVRGGPGWIHLPLLVAWLAGYLFSYYGQLALKTRTAARVHPQLLVYGTTTALAGLIVLTLRPRLLWAGVVFAPLLAVNAWYARRRRDRALPNGIASVVEGVLMAAIAVAAVEAPLRPVTGDVLALLLYFVGSLLYVKTMIRERGGTGYLRASIAFHLAALALVGWVSPWLLLPFGWLLARAVVLPRRTLTVKQVGLAELVGTLAVSAVLLLAR